MKKEKLFKSISLAVLTVAFICSVSVAQESQTKPKLNAAQEIIWKENVKNIKLAKATLEATYTDEQKAILGNKDLSAAEKKKALEASYSPAQKEISEKNKAQAKAGRERLLNAATK